MVNCCFRARSRHPGASLTPRGILPILVSDIERARDENIKYRIPIRLFIIVLAKRYDRRLGELSPRRITVPHIRPLRLRSLIEHRYNNLQVESILATAVMVPAVHASFPSSPPSGPSFVPASQAATPAHPFPAIFGNFHPFMRPNNTRGHLKGKLRFPWEKLRTGIGKIMISFHSTHTRARVMLQSRL